MASTIFTIYGIYANIPFEYHAKKIRLPVKIRMQIDLFYTTRNLLRSLLEQTVALPQNHKIKRLVAEVLAVFTNLTVSHAFNLHELPHFCLLDHNPIPEGRWASCKKDNKGEYLQRGMCDTIPTIPPFQISDTYNDTNRCYQRCLAKLVPYTYQYQELNVLTEHHKSNWSESVSELINSTNFKLRSIRGNDVTFQNETTLPSRVKRGRPRITNSNSVQDKIKILVESDDSDQESKWTNYIDEQLAAKIRAKENHFDEREREEERLEYEEELKERAQRLTELRKERIEPLTKKKKVKRTGVTRKRKCRSEKTQQDGNKSARLAKANTKYRLSGQEELVYEQPKNIFKVLPLAEKGLHRMPRKYIGLPTPPSYSTCISKENQSTEGALPTEPASGAESQVESVFDLFGQTSCAKEEAQEPVVLKLECVESDNEQINNGASSDEEYLDEYEYEEVAGNLEKVIEGRIYVLKLSDPPNEGNFWLSDEDIFFGSIEKVYHQDKIKVKILDLFTKCPKSNMGYLQKTEHDCYVPVDKIDSYVENLRYGDRTSKRMLLKNYYDSYEFEEESSEDEDVI